MVPGEVVSSPCPIESTTGAVDGLRSMGGAPGPSPLFRGEVGAKDGILSDDSGVRWGKEGKRLYHPRVPGTPVKWTPGSSRDENPPREGQWSRDGRDLRYRDLATRPFRLGPFPHALRPISGRPGRKDSHGPSSGPKPTGTRGNGRGVFVSGPSDVPGDSNHP